MTRTEVLSLLGLAQRAGAVISGTSGTREAIQTGRARLVILADDASETQLEKVRRILRHHTVPERSVGSRDELGAALGRSSLSAIAVTQDGFALRILELTDPHNGADDGDRGT